MCVSIVVQHLFVVIVNHFVVIMSAWGHFISLVLHHIVVLCFLELFCRCLLAFFSCVLSLCSCLVCLLSYSASLNGSLSITLLLLWWFLSFCVSSWTLVHVFDIVFGILLLFCITLYCCLTHSAPLRCHHDCL